MNVDQLRLNIEQLPPAAQDLSYYEKWSVSMLNHLRRSSAAIIDPASYRNFVDISSASSPSEGKEPRFAPGDKVVVREQGRTRTRAQFSTVLTWCQYVIPSSLIVKYDEIVTKQN